MPLFLTIDVGTTSVKTALIDETGKLKSLSLSEYTLNTPAENIIELETAVYWECTVRGIREVMQKCNTAPEEITAISVSSQGETLITLDEKGDPVRPAIVWMDNRSAEETEELKKRFGAGNTGLVDMTTTWPVTKALWLKRREPDTFRRISTYLMVEDYILYKLTGRFAGEYSLYSTTSMLDIINKEYWLEILDYIGIERRHLPELFESGEIIGGLTEEAASVLGLRSGTSIVTGAMDQTAGMIGAGNIRGGIITETTGAALAICKTLDTYPEKKERDLAIQLHAVQDKYLVTGWCAAGGMSMKWLRDTFFTEEAKRAEASGKDSYDLMAESADKIPPGCQGLQFFPFMAGPGTLPVDQSSRGCFNGLELHHGKSHFARAVMESLAYVLKENIELMKALGGDTAEIRSMGGGAKSAVWNQMKADITGLPVVTLECQETASIGVAMLAAAAVGVYDSIETAAKAMVRTISKFQPNNNLAETYNYAYNAYLSTERKFFGIYS